MHSVMRLPATFFARIIASPYPSSPSRSAPIHSFGTVIAKHFGYFLRVALIVSAGLALLACKGNQGSSPTPTPTPASVAVAPATVSLNVVGATIQLTASAYDASGQAMAGKTFTWTSSNDSVAKVDASGLVTAMAGGSATVTATAAGKSGSASVTVVQLAASVTVAPVTATISALGATVQLTAGAIDANGHAIANATFAWASSAESIAKVDASGLVTAVANGSATVTATANGKAGSANVIVVQQISSVVVTPGAPNLGALGATVQLAAGARDANGNAMAGKTFTWASSDKSVATVSASGLVTAVANGSARITATTEGGAGTTEVAVAQKAAALVLSPAGASISGAGTRQQFTVQARDAGGSLIPVPRVNAVWTSLNPNVATVNPLTGAAAAVGSGQVTIRVKVDEVVEYAVLTVTIPGLPRVNLWTQLDSGINNQIECLWGTSATDVFAAAHGATVLHYDGTAWSKVFQDIRFLNMGVWGSSASDVYVVGYAASVFHYDGALWSLITSGLSDMLSAVWGASPNDIYAVSWNGTIVHFDGVSWSTMAKPATDGGLYGVWGASANGVYAVGASLALNHVALHYDGTSWSNMSTGLERHIESVWGVSGTDIYAAFQGNVFHYDGMRWTRILYDAPISIWAIWGSSSTDIYFAGTDATDEHAAILHFDGTNWRLMRSPIPQVLHGLWGAPTGEVFASGTGGTILRGYRGGSVAITPSSATITGKNNRLQLAASATAGGNPVAGVTFLWTTSNAAVATVDGDGLVTGLTSGTASVTATALGDAAVTATVTVDLAQKPPVAVIDSPRQDMTITLGEAVNFQGTASDVDGTIASHSWDFGDDTGANVEDPGAHTYLKTGSFRVSYRVTDNDGASSPVVTVVITVVRNQSPTAAIISPADGAFFAPGTTIAFNGGGTDHEDGTLTGAALVWTSSRDGQIGTGSSFTRTDLSVGTHTITLSATDSGGAVGTAAVTIKVSTVAQIVPGAWHGSTTGLSLDFTVNSSADAVLELKYTFSGLKCEGATLVSGSITISRGSGWPISNRQFVITPSGDPKITVAGTFGDDGATVSGTWQWLSCSGTWTGSHY